MRVEGYLSVLTPLWAWEDEVAERMVETQECWLDLEYLIGERDDSPAYGVIFEDWPKLARSVAFLWRFRWK